MKSKTLGLWGSIFASILVTGSLANAQEKTVPATLRQNSAIAAANDTVLVGSVVSYTASSKVPPLGAHVVVQTATGTVDIHLGNALLLKQSNISLAPGDAVRIAGTDIPLGQGTIFAARILQKGTQTAVLRNARGVPLRAGLPRAAGSAQTQEGVR